MKFDFIDILSAWIDERQALLILIVMPLLTLIVTWRINKASERRAFQQRLIERSLSRQLKLADFRQRWIDEMRDDIAEYSALTWNSEINTGVESQKALVTLQARILMRMNPDDIDYPKLQSALATPVADQNEGRKALAIVARGILKREWERLKADLEDIEVSPQ
ncbi:hypothetical protein LY10_01027 [Planktotalea frisia]|jgi:hypothetical protein|uniref:Uncharacterized protein n=1 Tax=Planktotalea frisia TaxID=696762 RepID=A0A1L9P1G0_9RHOB|nr:hypothetical protein [Planktotalea frisia]OJI95336.1 hypothetical protein PFRI_04270 [Planktotalea frisia]PZX32479.1 hypothetical protein LY10_01027 [Planktotalea frisia]